MSNSIILLDDSTRPVAPKFDDLTLAQRAPGRHLAMIHNHFRQNMRQLQRIIDATESGSSTQEELKDQIDELELVQNYRQFGAICGQHCQIIHTHHSIEDMHIFPEISAKSAAFKKVVDRLIAEHEIVHALLLKLIDQLNAMLHSPAADTFKEVRETYQTLETVLLSHFGYEEDSIGDALGVFEIRV